MDILAPDRFHTHGQCGTLDIHSRNGAGCANDDMLLYTDDSISFFFNTSDTLDTKPSLSTIKQKKNPTQSFVLRAEQQSCVSLRAEMSVVTQGRFYWAPLFCWRLPVDTEVLYSHSRDAANLWVKYVLSLSLTLFLGVSEHLRIRVKESRSDSSIGLPVTSADGGSTLVTTSQATWFGD